MNEKPEFELRHFLPYLLNQAADQLSLEFQKLYREKYGMLRTEWRVLFHLGRYGQLTSKDICQRARIHKTKVSRAVAALEKKRYVARHEVEEDRRHALLELTGEGQRVFEDLRDAAEKFDAKVWAEFTAEEATLLRRSLIRIAGF